MESNIRTLDRNLGVSVGEKSFRGQKNRGRGYGRVYEITIYLLLFLYGFDLIPT